MRLAQEAFFRPPECEVIKEACEELNKVPLPSVSPYHKLQIPLKRSKIIQTNYKLRNDLYSGRNLRKTAAAEMLEAFRKMKIAAEHIKHIITTSPREIGYDLHDNEPQQTDGMRLREELIESGIYGQPFDDSALDEGMAQVRADYQM